MKPRLLFVVSSAFLSGCVGLAVGSFGTFESGNDVQPHFSKTREEIIKERGVPDATKRVGTCDVLTYNDGWSWSGVGAFVVFLPIPLIVPSGNDEEKIYIKDGRTVGEVSEYGEVTGMLGFMCGDNECGFRAGPVNRDKTRKAAVPWCE